MYFTFCQLYDYRTVLQYAHRLWVMNRLTLLQDAWKEERITLDLTEKLNNEIRLIISVYLDKSFALGSVRECNPSGKQRSINIYH
jgi:hypothetical protein